MEITETPVRIVKRRWMCRSRGYVPCDDGEMVGTGVANEHQCSKCGYKEFSPDSRNYPYIEFIDEAQP